MIRAIVVDDELLSLQSNERKLKESGVEVVKTFSNGLDLLDELNELDFHAAFLDIEMPGVNGLDLAKQIKEQKNDVCIVFVTAHRDYAIDAFELQSIDYLLKPILKDRLELTLKRIEKQLDLTPNSVTKPVNSSLQVVCFEEFTVYSNNEPVKWRTAKAKELFAFFITHLQSYINRDIIIENLWPHTDYQKAKVQLHTAVSYLRKTLDAAGYPGVLAFSNESYSLRLEDFHCDVIELEEVLNRYLDVNEHNIAELERVMHLYIGDYMTKNDYEWALKKAQHIRYQVLSYLQKMIDYYIQKGISNKQYEYLRVFMYHSPYSDYAVQQLMQWYIQVGNRGEAIKLYTQFKTTLHEDIGITPSEIASELYESILR